jgi:RES domain-containing protein
LTPLPAALIKGARPTTFFAWRLERSEFVGSWDQGIGAEKVGGRWSPRGRRVIYASIDPATTILEVAVHKGFATLDVVPHTLLCIEIPKTSKLHVVQPADIPNHRWLTSGSISAGQQDFGAQLLDKFPLILIPSVVSTRSWNLIIDVSSAIGLFNLHSTEPFGLDTRLNPVTPP